MSEITVAIDEIVDRYFDAWNAPTDARPAAVAAAFTGDAYYCDGAAESAGHAAIAEMMAGVMTQFDGAGFEIASPIDTHHQQARFGWRMKGSDGSTIIDGIDAIRFSDDGKITTTLGFFGVDIPSGD